ncbi:septation inhibitor protein [Bifidobacterium sp. DSM 109959]|uniref:Cell division protein CrgA n=2 Tax=Bifidobacterium olomucense TaxID=2675324 RepID=A0A7Y0EYT6_9BIFI|nr:septation inhibitor protein [Bifidobacterium sp. DSM 109959]
MADEELHETDSNDQKDWQNEVKAEETSAEDAKDVAESVESGKSDASEDEDETYGVDMEQVQAVLNATADKATLTPQMQRMMNRQAENTKRVEETIKGTKSNPRWFVPVFCAFMIVGLIWCVVYYLSPTGSWPIPNIGAWNLAIGFALIMVGFLMTMGWR